ncbi:MAG: hypothetical protein DRJ08_05820 [Acidobacteria bacterium]|nr:MAG: hypothetical protein DRJ14_07465 [Acidobacteriota bacterium]RLE21270.1 MAG: hypothetical protein DRJ08_05820 [Acidobacteriota bacterium]
MKQVLIINCFKRDDYAKDFDRAISRRLGQTDSHVVRMTGLKSATDSSSFSHLIISGSETSVLDNYPWTAALEELVRKWVDEEKPVLGICYGHQFLARALAGRDAVRRSRIPEFGWADIELTPCTLFGKLKRLTAMVSHYDEVCELPETDFRIFAKTVQCGIHAFQYRNLPTWGVQFHPEYGPKEAEFIFQQVRKSDPGSEKYFIGTSPQPDELKDCRQIFDNFLAM